MICRHAPSTVVVFFVVVIVTAFPRKMPAKNAGVGGGGGSRACSIAGAGFVMQTTPLVMTLPLQCRPRWRSVEWHIPKTAFVWICGLSCRFHGRGACCATCFVKIAWAKRTPRNSEERYVPFSHPKCVFDRTKRSGPWTSPFWCGCSHSCVACVCGRLRLLRCTRQAAAPSPWQDHRKRMAARATRPLRCHTRKIRACKLERGRVTKSGSCGGERTATVTELSTRTSSTS